MSLSVRPATVADVPALERIWVDAGRAAWAQILQPDTLAALTPPDALRRALAEDGPLVLVVEEDATVVGFADACPDERGDALVRAWRLDGTEWHQSWQGSEFVEVGYRIELTSLDRA